MKEQTKGFTIDQLKVKIYNSRLLMGEYAAREVSSRIKKLLSTKTFVNIIFAAAPSQNEFLSALSKKKLDWNRINAFHMDEYVGLDQDSPERFGNFLKERLFDKVPFHSVHYLDGSAENLQVECQRYAHLLEQYRPDIVCMGIGENTHVAFNDPHVADFNDPLMVKVVDLDNASRMQQVHDNCFARIEEVPCTAITLTVPVLFNSDSIFCITPGNNKAEAVSKTLYGEISERYPSTILRLHPDAKLYLDQNSAAKLKASPSVIDSKM
jgi:glucosamine-6-phosphate deaminase